MRKTFLAIVLLFILCGASSASAYELQMLDNTPIEDDFVIGPGKIDLVLDPGEESTQQIVITNRLGRDRNFKVEIEDFSGSYSTDRTVVFFGDEKGPYSMRDYIKPEISEFSLKHGERIILSINIDIPDNAEAGGLYTSVMVAAQPDEDSLKTSAAGASVVTRLASLLFVRVSGDVNESMRLEDFRAKVSDTPHGFFEEGPIPFEIILKNDGNIHVAPTGKIEIRNLLGKRVGEVTVDRYFVMPNSVRARVVNWENSNLLGRYTASLSLDKNYQGNPNESEQAVITFWVIPWKILLGVFVGLLILWRLTRFILSKFKFEIKKK